jgi:hypothetical protein
MSLEDLDAYVWSQLSPRRYAAGRPLVARLTRRVVRKFPHEVMSQAKPESCDVVMHEIARSIERSERQNYGMGIILTLVLSALLSEIVKAVLRWWMQSASHRAVMLGWQTEVRK